MKKPVIGLTPAHAIENDSVSLMPTYIRAVENAGGVPVIFPLELSVENLTVLANLCQGFIFTGGPDPILIPSCGEKTSTKAAVLFL